PLRPSPATPTPCPYPTPFRSDYLRPQWPLAWPRDPVPVSADGTATLAGVTVSLVEARDLGDSPSLPGSDWEPPAGFHAWRVVLADRKSTRLNSSHVKISYAVF